MPLPVLLLQSLQKMSYDKPEIVLTNEGLEDKDIEELVNILTEFPNPKVTTLDLSSNNLRKSSGTLLGTLIQIKILNVSHNKLGDEGVIALTLNKSLQKLDVSYNGLTNKSAHHLLGIEKLGVILEGNPCITLPSLVHKPEVAATLSNLSRSKDSGMAALVDDIAKVKP